MITAILSLDMENGLGVDDKLAVYDTDDLKHFKESTIGKICISGVKTLPQVRYLPNRDVKCFNPKKYHKEISKNGILKTLNANENVIGIDNLDLEEVLELSKTNEIMIIGGLATYKAFAKYTDKVILTKFKTVNPNCTHFLDIDEVYPHLQSLEILSKHEKFNIYSITK